MKFRYDKIELPSLQETPVNGKRHYRTPEGKLYPSVTTVLSGAPSPGLDAWRARMGEAEATRIGAMMARRGQNLHNICEKYLLNDPNPTKGQMIDVQFMFRQMKSELDKLDELLVIEGQLYSDVLGIAGRCDTIAHYIGDLSVVDFKTTNTPTEFTMDMDDDNKVKKYFMQCYAYKRMFEERTGRTIKYGVLMVASMDYPTAVYVDDLDRYAEDFLKVLTQYKKTHNVVN